VVFLRFVVTNEDGAELSSRTIAADAPEDLVLEIGDVVRVHSGATELVGVVHRLDDTPNEDTFGFRITERLGQGSNPKWIEDFGLFDIEF
jgi:hypothetical protein